MHTEGEYLLTVYHGGDTVDELKDRSQFMPIDVHPIIVHFPIALIIVVCLLDWSRWFLDRDHLQAAGFWGGTTPLLVTALLTAIVAVISGLLAEGHVVKTLPLHELIETHELVAFITSGGLAVLTFWRIALRGAFPRNRAWVYLFLLLIVTLAVTLVGYYGGLMVFEHGAGVNRHPAG